MQISSENNQTGTIFFNSYLNVASRKISSYKFNINSTLLMRMGEFYFLVSNNDSIHILYNNTEKKYEIDGGMFPGNYTLYQDVTSIKVPLDSYKKEEDNYNSYVKQIDSVTSLGYAIINRAWEKGTVSPDVYQYVNSYIKYMHIYKLLFHKSSTTFRQYFPKNSSRYVSEFSINEFLKEENTSMLVYPMALSSYVNTIAKIQDSSNFKYFAIDYTIRNFTGTIRNILLHELLVNYSYGREISKSQLQELFGRIQKINIPDTFLTPITEQYVKVMISGKPIDSNVSSVSQLRTIDEQKLSFKQLQTNSFKGKKVLLDFWASWCGPCIESLPKVKKLEKDFAVFYFSLDTDSNRWKSAAKKYQVDKNQYLLINDYQNPLALYLLISAIPRYIMLDEYGTIKNAEESIPNY